MNRHARVVPAAAAILLSACGVDITSPSVTLKPVGPVMSAAVAETVQARLPIPAFSFPAESLPCMSGTEDLSGSGAISILVHLSIAGPGKGMVNAKINWSGFKVVGEDSGNRFILSGAAGLTATGNPSEGIVIAPLDIDPISGLRTARLSLSIRASAKGRGAVYFTAALRVTQDANGNVRVFVVDLRQSCEPVNT